MPLKTIPIGRAIANTQLYILDSHLNPVPIGVQGELYVGGLGVGRGYLNRPELTQAKFISNPFSKDEGDLLYKTGDLARYLRDGTLEFLGRIDNQVKIRGFRIELGEIEAALSAYAPVQQAVVIAQQEPSGHRRLVAYLVSGENALTTGQLREYLKTQLPDHMVPSAFVILARLPLTPNGKIDRKALPAPDTNERETTYVSPRTPSEEIICNLFAGVLDVDTIGIHDNFFELGGHSLLATQLISRLREAFSLKIPLRELFTSPTVAQLDSAIAQLQSTQHQLALPPIQPRTQTQRLPLSWAQERLWFIDRLEGQSATYNLPATVRISGRLNPQALQQALSEIVRRHEVLRTSFHAEGGQPIQVVHPDVTVNINRVDLQALDATAREHEISKQIEIEATTPFDLEKAPLMRCHLLHLDSQEYVLCLTMHHIISDGWSMGILIQEVYRLYQAFYTGDRSALSEVSISESPISELPIQYADFALWQRQQLSGKRLDTQLDYWQQQLAGAPDLLQLPTDRPRPSVQSDRGSLQRFMLNAELTQKVKTLAQTSGTTLFMTLQAAFSTLLYRYSGQSDILVGSPIANRNRSEIEPLIGFFVNTLVLRSRFENNPSFRQLLAQVRETTLKAYENQDVPFEKIVEALQPQRSLSHSPLFQVMFVLQNAPMGDLALPDLTLSLLEKESTVAQFDLTLSMTERDRELVGEWEYNTDLFDGATITRMAGHFQALLEAVVENCDRAVNRIPLLSEAERHQVLVAWNDTQKEYAQETCIHQLFEAQVEKTPDAIAAVFDGQQLTYGELNRQANQLARHLQTLGVKAEVLVGICLERSLDMIVGLLGILKAGAAYVPLDPNYPQDRLNEILADAAVEVLLTQRSLQSALPAHPAQVVFWQRDGEAHPRDDHSTFKQYSQENLNADVTGDNLAYVLYTSGSTGKPKGVMITHHALSCFTQSMVSEYGITARDRLLQFASINFDVAAEEIYPALCQGATLVLPTRDVVADFKPFCQFCQASDLTVLNLPAPYWHQLVVTLQKIDLTLPDSLRLVVIGSDKVLLEPVKYWQKYVTEAGGRDRLQLMNAYGTTETTVTTTVYPIPLDTCLDNQDIPIGSPIANTQTYILDEQRQPVPIGVAGELYIGGAGLARGYLNRPELTQEKFIPHPFAPDSGRRLYKTGDLARYLPDGNIEHLGRIDNQVKIRGFRIELGDVETAINSHPNIERVVVMTKEDSHRQKNLIAYIVADTSVTDLSLMPGELREYLKGQLPNYMLPSAVIPLERLPLMPNGKIDRKALPEPETIERATACIAPSTPREETIANIFGVVLEIDNIGIYDNFFELGGHSLLATQLMSRVREAFALEVPLRALFESPTVAELDQVIAQLQRDNPQNNNPSLALLSIQPRDASAELTLSFAQERLWFIDFLEGNSTAYNMSGAFRIVGDLDIEALQQTLQEIVARHEVLRTGFVTKNGSPVQIIQPEAQVNINLVNLQSLDLAAREQTVLKAAKAEAATPFDLEKPPLMRGRLLQLAAQESVLLLTLHHITSDGWSMGIFIEEVSRLYQAFSQGKPSPLEALPIQYADFSLWQRQYLKGEYLARQLDYWKQQLTGAPDLLQLPTDRPRPNEQTYRGKTQRFSLSSALTQQINELSQKSGTTLFMTLQAAFSTLLHRYSGQSDICIGSPIANRNHSELERLIGFFVNTLVLRTRFENNPNFEQLLSQVRETTLEAYAHQEVPFENIVEALQPERSLSHSPLFQTMFALQNAPGGDIALPNLTLSQLDLDTDVAKFDLTLFMTETETGLVGDWEYNTDLFDSSTIERMASHFQTLLEAIVEQPTQNVSDLPLLSAVERDRILIDWNDTATDYPHDRCIHTLFEHQAESTPDAIAVVFEGKQLTYQDLNQKANQLAHYLQTLGIKPDALVGICLDRSVEMVIGLLGILKAGGAYVPIDPNYPTERLSYLLSDADVDVLLTQQSLREALPEHNAKTLCLDSDWETIEQQSPENLKTEIDAQNLAYVIYTSGSTGKPKGAMNTHQGIRNRLLWMQAEYQLTSSDRVLQKTPFSFDVSVWEFFWPLITGASLVVAKPEGHKDRDYLVELIVEENITTLHFVPSMLQAFLQGENVEACQCLKRVICSGEALPFDLTQLFFSKLPCELHNLYGPTEAAIDVSCWQCHPNADVQIVPIGKPIANTQLYILDKQLKPVPIGVAGELHIGGEGLARGYLNRVELTQERFISIPAQSVLNREGRLYKTGDLARYLPDGNIEYLGRLDNQVKIRGFRIELGEIEAALGQHSQVRQTVVIAQADSNGNKRLVAYIVAETSLSHSQLRGYLKSQLPEYAIPAFLVTLEHLPLTPNGKVDRKALPAPDTVERASECAEPRTAQEQLLVNIWKELLPVQEVGIHDNFFEIGGDSILSIQVISRAKSFGLKISAKQIFQYQTIAELASVASTATKVECQQGLVTGTAPLTPIQRWFFSEQITQLHHFNQSVLLQVPADINPDILQQALAKLLEHHDALRLRFTKETEADHQQINHDELHPEAPLAIIDLSKAATAEQPQAIEKIATEFQASLDISTGTVMQTVLFNLGDNVEARLLVIIHHLVVDGVSWRILLEDLETLYQQLMAHSSLQLPAKTTAFIDWAKKLDEYGRSHTITQELDYWLSQPWAMASPLPLDCSDENLANTVGDSQDVSVKLNQAETTALLESSNEAYNTQINDILLSALGIALADWTGNLKVLIALEGHGREEIFDDVDISRTVGWFTSLFPVLLDLPKGNELASIIKSTKEQLRAIPERGIGFGIFRYLSSPDMSDRIKTIPTPEICFNYLGQFDQMQSESGWQLASESTGEDASPQILRSHLLDINALIVEGELQITWTYSDCFHHKKTVEGLAQSYLQAIRRVIEHCQQEEHSGYTPSDFPNADLDQSDLDELLGSFDL